MASQPAFRTEESRKRALPVPLQDFSTSPTHHWKSAKVKVSKLYNKIADIRKDFAQVVEGP